MEVLKYPSTIKFEKEIVGMGYVISKDFSFWEPFFKDKNCASTVFVSDLAIFFDNATSLTVDASGNSCSIHFL